MSQVQLASSDIPLNIIPIGGLGEIGLNMMVLEWGDEILVVDCGLMFPEDHMLGIDIVIPDITYLREKAEKITAIILTHGHEDHIGALPFVLKEIQAPIYGTRLTLELVKEKCREHGIADLISTEVVEARETKRLGHFQIEFIHVCHSIPDGVGLAIHTPQGVIIHSGDFKYDPMPVDERSLDFPKFAEYGEEGVLALLSDSTNVEREGFSISERDIGNLLGDLFLKSPGRVIVALFATNIHRIQGVLNISHRLGRKVFISGRSLLSSTRVAQESGYLTVPNGLIIDSREVANLPSHQITMLTTGSQGEPLSALTRLAMGDHKQLQIEKGDTVILSSRFIPGHEKAIAEVINHLYRRGAEVIYEKVADVHVSGHANQEELKLMLNITRPKYFIPIHGEYRHLVRHTQLAREMGIPEENLLLAENGDIIQFVRGEGRIQGKVDSGRVLVDGKGVGDVGAMILRDRRHLAEGGMVIAIAIINSQTGELMGGPDIFSRGFIFEEEQPELLEQARAMVREALTSIDPEIATDWMETKNQVQRTLRKFFSKTMARRPLIVPVIIEV